MITHVLLSLGTDIAFNLSVLKWNELARKLTLGSYGITPPK